MGVSARVHAVWAIRAKGTVLLHRGDGEGHCTVSGGWVIFSQGRHENFSWTDCTALDCPGARSGAPTSANQDQGFYSNALCRHTQPARGSSAILCLKLRNVA